MNFIKIIIISAFFLICLPLEAADSAKYIFLFIGDGMSAASEFATSSYLYGEGKKLEWNSFKNKTFAATWSLSCITNSNPSGYDIASAGITPYPYYLHQNAEKYFETAPASDSAASATAMATGQKTENGHISTTNTGEILTNIFDILNKQKIYNTCLITTTFFYDATPAAFAAHNISRQNRKQIAEEILSVSKPEIIIARNEYGFLKDTAETNGYYVTDSKEIKNNMLFYTDSKKLFVIIDNYNIPVPENEKNKPSFSYRQDDLKFSEIALFAADKLLAKKKPFFAVIEMSDIDSANHDNDYHTMVSSVYELHNAVKSIIELINSGKTDMTPKNTLVLVTADHATGFLRFNEQPRKGRLPSKMIFTGKNMLLKFDRTVKYKSKNHTNELVGIYAFGTQSDLLKIYAGKNGIIDNTDIFKILKKTAVK